VYANYTHHVGIDIQVCMVFVKRKPENTEEPACPAC